VRVYAALLRCVFCLFTRTCINDEVRKCEIEDIGNLRNAKVRTVICETGCEKRCDWLEC